MSKSIYLVCFNFSPDSSINPDSKISEIVRIHSKACFYFRRVSAIDCNFSQGSSVETSLRYLEQAIPCSRLVMEMTSMSALLILVRCSRSSILFVSWWPLAFISASSDAVRRASFSSVRALLANFCLWSVRSDSRPSHLDWSSVFYFNSWESFSWQSAICCSCSWARLLSVLSDF